MRILSLALSTLLLTAAPLAAKEPLNGKPPAGFETSVKDFAYHDAYRYAYNLAEWAMPAVSIYGFKRAIEHVGGGPNVILAWSRVADANAELLTANNNTPYILAYTDLKQGPVVVEVPAKSDKALLYGQIVDQWQWAIADVGPIGLDKGKGGKYLLLPPGYNGKVPEGYIVLKSPTYRVYFAFRSIKTPDATFTDAYAYAKRIRMYYLNDLRPTRFIDPAGRRFPTLPRYELGFYEDLHAIFTHEPLRSDEKVMRAYMKYLGIEKGQPFAPDAKMQKAMTQAVGDFYYDMQHLLTHPTPRMLYWPDRRWQDVLVPDSNGNFSYDTGEMLDVRMRANRYFFATFYPRSYYDPPANIYLFTMVDKNGDPIDGKKLYRLKVPADTPVTQFWSVILYDADTWAFIYNPWHKYGISSFDMKKLKKDPDGGVTLYFGPKPPKGLESNWIPTQGRRVAPSMRFYGAKKAIVDRSWKMPDVEPAE